MSITKPYMQGAVKQYTPEDHERIMASATADLSPAEFFHQFREKAKLSGSSGIRKNMVPADDLYELYVYYSEVKGKPLSGNALVKVIRAEGTKCSNERAKLLAEEFAIKFEEEGHSW